MDRTGAEGRAAQARVLADGLDALEVLHSQQILHMMELPEVPRNTRLIKGVLESGARLIPLMDTRVSLNAPSSHMTDRACVVIVDLGGVMVGLILDSGLEA